VAAASKAPKGKRGRPAGSKTGKKTARGLQLSAAQWKAYRAGAAAKSRQIAISRAASGFRRSRLAAAYSTAKKYNAVYHSAQTAAVAAFAVKQSYLQSVRGHQNASLQNRIKADYFRHAKILGRLQFAQAGERKYVTKAVLRTVTQSQAVAHEKQVFAHARRAAGKASRSVQASPGSGRNRSKFTAAQQASVVAAGLAAARKAPAGRQAPSSLVATGKDQGPWLGRPEDANCVPVAVANAMLLHTGYRVPPLMFRRLERACGPGATIPQGLAVLGDVLAVAGHPVRVAGVTRVPAALGLVPGHVIGFRAPLGPHAAVSLPGRRVISWGQELPYEGTTEEAWAVSWKVAG
jgi:hypothetical protein